MTEAGYGVWGFSPSNTPEGGYDAYGVDGIGMNPTGGYSDEAKTLIDHGFAGCPGRDPVPDPPPSATRTASSPRTPPSWRCATRRRDALSDLARLRQRFPDIYGKWGFRDSVNVTSGHVSGAYLSLDQGMIMAALGNALGARRPAARVRRPCARARPAPGHRHRALRRVHFPTRPWK